MLSIDAVDTLARKTKETRQHLENFAKDKLASLEKNCNGSSKLEHYFIDASKTAVIIAATVSLMDKRLKDISKYAIQADLDVKHELLGLDKKT